MRPATITLWKRLLILIVVLPVTGYLAFAVTIHIGQESELAWQPVRAPEASWANILVFAPDSSPRGFSLYLVPVQTAPQYVREHPGSTLLIPLDRQKEVEQEFANRFGDHTRLEVGRTRTREQQITLETWTHSGDFDGDRYVAYPDHAELTGHRHIGDRDGMGYLILAMVLAVLVPFILGLSCLIWMLLRWRRELQSIDAKESTKAAG